MYLCVARYSSLRIPLALTICIALLLTPSVPSLVSSAAQGQGSDHARQKKPRPGKPKGLLPDLDEIQNESQIEREPALLITSRLYGPWGRK
jgi:hypothetical protein